MSLPVPLAGPRTKVLAPVATAPLTSKGYAGAAVPIPTFPTSLIVMRT